LFIYKLNFLLIGNITPADAVFQCGIVLIIVYDYKTKLRLKVGCSKEYFYK